MIKRLLILGLLLSCALLPLYAAVTEVAIAKGFVLTNVRTYLGVSARPPALQTEFHAVAIAVDNPLADLNSVRIDAIEALGDGYYRCTIHADATARNGKYTLAFRDADPRAPRERYWQYPVTLDVYVKDIVVRAISFRYGMHGVDAAGSLPVCNPYDDSEYGRYDAADTTTGWDWYDGAYNYPIRYVKGTRDRYLRVMLLGPKNLSVRISASGGFGDGITARTVRFRSDGIAVEDFRIADNPLSAVVQRKNLTLLWHAQVNGHMRSINATDHRVYITGGVPAPGKPCGLPYWQVLDIGTRARGTLEGIRHQFNRRLKVNMSPNVQTGNYAPYELKYYGSVSAPFWDALTKQTVYYEPNLAITSADHHSKSTRMLLTEGDGHCGAFAKLEYDVLQYQGIDADLVYIVASQRDYRYFRVKSHYAQGRSGETSDIPPTDFTDHCVVKIVGVDAYEDPSYGAVYEPGNGARNPLEAFKFDAIEALVDEKDRICRPFSDHDLDARIMSYAS